MSDSWKDQWDSVIMPTYGTPPAELVEGHGSWVTDSEGTQYLDFLSGIAVNALGHAHPAIVDAVSAQIRKVGHTSNLLAHPQVIKAAENIVSVLPAGAEGSKVFFCNSGSEANEAAFKIARSTGKTKILAAERGFHGRTMGALAMTGQPEKREPFAPLPAGVEFFPYGDLDAVKQLADQDTAAIIVESIQGETGVIPASPGFLKGLRDLCDELDIVFIVDEVQAGMGRTGQWFGFQAVEPAGILPDVITMAKGLGGGLPIGACVATPRAQLLAKGMQGTTFGCNPIACAAANAVFDTIKQHNLLANVRVQSEKIRTAMQNHPAVKLVRGEGLMLGVVLHEPLATDPVDVGLLLNRPAPDVMRIVPPLNLSDEDTQAGVDKLLTLLNQQPQQEG